MLTLKRENTNWGLKRVVVDYPMDQVADSVFKLKHLWESRSDDFPFFTLGKFAYLDGDSPEYFSGARELNEVLMKTFRPLYEKISEVIDKELGEEVFLDSGLALPAFHIFPSDKKLLSISGDWHVDNPHPPGSCRSTNLDSGDISQDSFDLMSVRSFTLPVMLPTGGGGVDFKDGYCPYSVGEMVIHDGQRLHRIASFKKYKKDEYRITVQGHIARNDEGKLIMFL